MAVLSIASRPDRGHIAPVTSREELIYLLSRASELEHGLACIYLFAAYSLKSDIAEGGLTDAQAVMVRGWKRRLAKVAIEEMFHLAQVSNMLTAIGGAPHFKRANFPMPSSAFPFGLRLSLEPFSQEVIERFVCYEMPESGVLRPEQEAVYAAIRSKMLALEGVPPADSARDAGEGGAPIAPPHDAAGASCEPYEIDFKTVGEFYHKVRTGFESISEDELFIGPPQAQSNSRYVDLDGELIPVTDRASACAAIEMIVEQGEAPSSAHPDAHFVVFDTIRKEFEGAVADAQADGTTFDPVRPAVSNPMTRFYDDTSGGSVISDQLTHEVADLFNGAYDTMLLMLLRFFAHLDETEEELRLLSRGTMRLMASVLRPLGEALTKMPAGPGFAAKTAGPGFGYNRDVHLLAHKTSAWVFFLERIQQLVAQANALSRRANVLPQIAEAAAALQSVGEHLVQYLPEQFAKRMDFRPGDKTSRPTIAPEPDGPYIVSNLTSLTNSKGESLPTRPSLALCRCGGSALKPYCDGTHARIGFSSQKLPGRVADHRDNYNVGNLTIHDNRGICQHSGYCTDNLSAVFRVAKEPFVDPTGAAADAIVNQVRQCPSGALSHSIDGVEHRDQDRPPTITVSKNGPYRITGGADLEDDTWGEGASREHYALCRCGHSKNKPFCDGSHWYVKFTDDDN